MTIVTKETNIAGISRKLQLNSESIDYKNKSVVFTYVELIFKNGSVVSRGKHNAIVLRGADYEAYDVLSVAQRAEKRLQLLALEE